MWINSPACVEFTRAWFVIGLVNVRLGERSRSEGLRNKEVSAARSSTVRRSIERLGIG